MSSLFIVDFLGFCLGLMACSILLFANKTHRYANNFLVISLAALALSILQGIMASQGYFLQFPHLFRTFSPLFYLIMPAAYLYVRSIVLDETRLRKWDFVHLLPALLHVVELIPWYILDVETKRDLIRRYLSGPEFLIQLNEGLLPAYMHNMTRGVLAIVYLILMHRLLSRHAASGSPNSAAFRWLRTFSFLLSFLVVFFLATLLLPAPAIGRTNMINIIISVIFIVINFYLFSKPQILYGIPQISMDRKNEMDKLISVPESPELLPRTKSDEVSPNTLIQTEALKRPAFNNLSGYVPVIETHLATSKPFLKPGYSLIDLAEETEIPRHHLSALLNKIYGIRFNDFINRYRVQYILQNMDDPKWPTLTLEGISREAGFNSRTTFFNAIKKFTGLSPSEFLEKAKKKQVDLFQNDFTPEFDN